MSTTGAEELEMLKAELCSFPRCTIQLTVYMSADFMQFLDSVGKYDHKENKHAVGAIYILWWVSHDYADRQFGQQ